MAKDTIETNLTSGLLADLPMSSTEAIAVIGDDLSQSPIVGGLLGYAQPGNLINNQQFKLDPAALTPEASRA